MPRILKPQPSMPAMSYGQQTAGMLCRIGEKLSPRGRALFTPRSLNYGRLLEPLFSSVIKNE